uniref:Uncharacterized protein n=1 Tax=Panagrolaimus sp. JU765 TaxID=591449 RepID=A0AC34R6C2_9BILA
MVRKKVDPKTVKEIANRLIVHHGPETRLYDDLLYAILTFKGYRYDERFKIFSEFVDLIDPERTRPHLLFPILARCPDLNDKKTILFQSKLIGYDDFSQMDSRMMVNTFYIPMLVELENDFKLMDSERLSQV